MSNIRAISGSSKIVHRNQGGGSKLQGIPSSTNLNTSAHVAFRNRNVVCACNRDIIFCMNQLGGVGAGGIPGRSYAFAPGADGTHKQFSCGHRFNNYLNNNKHLILQKSIELNISIGKIKLISYKYIKGYILTSNNTPGEFILNPPPGKTITLVKNGRYMLKRYNTEIYYIEVLETQPQIIIKILRVIKTKTEVDKLRENELYIVNSAPNIRDSKIPSGFTKIYESLVDYSQILHEFKILYELSQNSVGYILFNNYTVVRRITTMNYTFLNGSTRFHLINDNGNKKPNDLLDKEYIILGYYYRHHKNIGPFQFHFKIKNIYVNTSGNDWYEIKHIVPVSTDIDIFNDSFYITYIFEK